MMRKSTKLALWSVGIVFVVIIALSLFGIIKLVPQAGLAKTFTPVYCNDPTSLCCVKTVESSTDSLSATNFFKCDAVINCVVKNVQGQANIYVGSQNCRVVKDISTLFISQYKCDDGVKKGFLSGSVSLNVPKGYTIYADRNTILSIDSFGQKLVSNLGVNVLADSCTYNVPANKKITDDGVGLGTSYTVPVGGAVGTMDSCILSWVAGDRHICGNLEEQCTADTDCIGHTFGNKECNNRVLQTYGCKQLSLPNNLGNIWDDNKLYAPLGNQDAVGDSFDGVISRCEIKSAVQVQCCGDTDCGTNFRCDIKDFTCKPAQQVECEVDSDCGVSVQCDFGSKSLKTPICSGGNCDFSVKPVGCCVDLNCPIGQFCNADYECEVRVNPDVPCPFACCDRDAGYFDRACNAGLFCVNHECLSIPECEKDADCNANYECDAGKCVSITPLTCEDSFFGLVKSDVGVKEDCEFWCVIGLKSPERVDVCVRDYVPLALVLLTILAVLGIAVLSKKKGKRGGKGSNVLSGENAVWKKKGFWIILGILFAVALIIGYFKYFFWAVIILFALALAYIIVRIFVFKKIW